MSLPQRAWVARRIDRMPPSIGREMLSQHAALVGTVGPASSSPFYLANLQITAQRNELLKAKVWNAYDEEAIHDHAENFARLCAAMPMLAEREEFAVYCGVTLPVAKFLSDRYEARAARLADPLWWRHQLRVVWTRSAEEAIRRLGAVRKGKSPYASDAAVNHRSAQKRRMRDYCESHVAVNELGEQLGLFDVQQGSVSNPTLRRGEFMTRVRGFEELAESMGYQALFFTLTTPSHFHPQLATGGGNPAYDPRQTVRTAQAWLCKMWARFRAKVHRKKLIMYGFRIAEPHHDGTPHWHGLLFVRTDAVRLVSDQLVNTFLAEFADQPGAREHRVRIEHVDKSKGSAAGYIAKYVAKNIDGFGAIGGVESDETGTPVMDGVQRVDAWASIHGIRQFQQLGGPPVGLWRECRRLREPVADPDIERARAVADRGDFGKFARCVGGALFSRETLLRQRTTLQLFKEETGEVNRYGECRAARIFGLKWGRHCARPVITRTHRWRIERRGRSCSTAGPARHRRPDSAGSGSSSGSPSYLGPVAITVRKDPPPPGWLQMTVKGVVYQFWPQIKNWLPLGIKP